MHPLSRRSLFVVLSLILFTSSTSTALAATKSRLLHVASSTARYTTPNTATTTQALPLKTSGPTGVAKIARKMGFFASIGSFFVHLFRLEK